MIRAGFPTAVAPSGIWLIANELAPKVDHWPILIHCAMTALEPTSACLNDAIARYSCARTHLSEIANLIVVRHTAIQIQDHVRTNVSIRRQSASRRNVCSGSNFYAPRHNDRRIDDRNRCPAQRKHSRDNLLTQSILADGAQESRLFRECRRYLLRRAQHGIPKKCRAFFSLIVVAKAKDFIPWRNRVAIFSRPGDFRSQTARPKDNEFLKRSHRLILAELSLVQTQRSVHVSPRKGGYRLAWDLEPIP